MSSVCGVEDADVGALGVEPALAHVLAAGEERVGCRSRRRCRARSRPRPRSPCPGRTPARMPASRWPARRPAGTARTRESRRCVRSTPVGLSAVTIERQRGRKSRCGRDQREALFRCTMPPAVSACSVRYMTVSGCSPRPASRMRVSMSCGPELQRLAVGAWEPGSARSAHGIVPVEPGGEPDVLQAERPAGAGCRTPTAVSRRETARPASPSNSSRYACPDRFGSGLVNGELGIDVEQRRRGSRGHQLVDEAG